ncbi:MAG: hypothetical protein WD336_03915 [Trueperaceae bacterium]
MIPGFERWAPRYGDLHSHCDLSYGHGSREEALCNARLQLDFVSVTVHGAWPDVPDDDPELGYLVDYHRRGFERAREGWDAYARWVEDSYEPGRLVTLPSFEWHSRRYGDYCAYFRDPEDSRIIDAGDLPELRDAVHGAPGGAMLIPHHTGYQHGHRGIDWDAFREASSPLAEIVSFHGAAESCDGPVPYLHAMGPRVRSGTARHGWASGHRFGVVGGTDHHNAVPGAYGFGRTGAWLTDLTRESLWEALRSRRTYALTGDRIALAFAVDGTPMGGVAAASEGEREIDVAVRGGHGLEYVEILHDERVVHRASLLPRPAFGDGPSRVKVHVEVGWGERREATAWDVELHVRDGRLVDVEPRFRGPFPSAAPPFDGSRAPHALERCGTDGVRFTTRTFPNPHSAVAATEGVCLEFDADAATEIEAVVNGVRHRIPVRDLSDGARSAHLGGFVSPAIAFGRAVPESEFATRFRFRHHARDAGLDAYRVRVRQRNDQWAWSSPVWMGAATQEGG